MSFQAEQKDYKTTEYLLERTKEGPAAECCRASFDNSPVGLLLAGFFFMVFPDQHLDAGQDDHRAENDLQDPRIRVL